MTRLTAILAVLAAALGGTAAYAQTHHGHASVPKQPAVRPAARHANAWATAASTAKADRGQAAQGEQEPGDDRGQDSQAEQELGDDRGQQGADHDPGPSQNQGPGSDDGSDDGGQGSGHGDNGSDG